MTIQSFLHVYQAKSLITSANLLADTALAQAGYAALRNINFHLFKPKTTLNRLKYVYFIHNLVYNIGT